MKVGAVTIGQSPRTDILAEMLEILGPHAQVLERGALDELDREELQALLPKPSEHFLVTRLRDGGEIKVAEKRMHGLLGKCVADLERADVDIIMILCTAEFPELSSSKLILRADQVLLHTVRSVFARGKLGILVPAAEQIPALRQRWAAAGYDPVVEAASPYTATLQELRESAATLARSGVELVVLDCIGFTRRVSSVFREVIAKPVLLPRTLVARIARELAGS
jgi:protein AroM